MRATNWSAPTDPDVVNRRAGGRRRYNAWRAFRAEYRRTQVAALLDVKGGMSVRGTQAEIARRLDVNRSTICRDLALLHKRLFVGADPLCQVRERLIEMWSREVLMPKGVEADLPAVEDAPSGHDDPPIAGTEEPVPEIGTTGTAGSQPGSPEAVPDGDGPAFEPV
jgi:hypothetical protein